MPRNGSNGIGGHQQPHHGKTDSWLTPPSIVSALGAFDLDPCVPFGMPWRTAALHFTEFEDGLWQSWRGRVWLNPPYGAATGDWLAKLADHGCGTALVFARTETGHWFDHVWPKATAILFLKGRIHFHWPSGERAAFNSGAPSALVAYGHDDANELMDALVFSRLSGHYVSLR